MSAYKLVVVDPFENYSRGSEIVDQEIVSRILDVNDEMHVYERHVRRVEFKIEDAPQISPVAISKIAIETPQEDQQTPSKKSTTLRINSIKDDAVDGA